METKKEELRSKAENLHLEDERMKEREVKIYSKESSKLALHVIPGHFATSNSHINYYVDVTTLKSRVSEAREAAHVFYTKLNPSTYIDTIVCLDGTEAIAAFLSEELESQEFLSTNAHETHYVVAPEINSSNQLMFRDNNKPAIYGKHVILLMASSTTGETIRRALECVKYYGGIVEGVLSIFSTLNSVDGVWVTKLFGVDDVVGYASFPAHECPFCKQGRPIEAIVNGYGYSKL